MGETIGTLEISGKSAGADFQEGNKRFIDIRSFVEI